jgi:ABC-type Fe3+ transport system substrate-binding protein
MQQGKKKPEEWAAFVAQILAAQGQKILKEGKPLETPEEHMAELTTQAHEFSVKQLPIFKALQIA